MKKIAQQRAIKKAQTIKIFFFITFPINCKQPPPAFDHLLLTEEGIPLSVRRGVRGEVINI